MKTLRLSLKTLTISMLLAFFVFGSTVSFASPPKTSVTLFGTAKSENNKNLSDGETDPHWKWSLDDGVTYTPAIVNTANDQKVIQHESAIKKAVEGSYRHRAKTTFTVADCAVGEVTIKINGDIANGFVPPQDTVGTVELDNKVVISDTTPGHNFSKDGPFAEYAWKVTPGTHSLEWIHGLGKDTIPFTGLNVDIDYRAQCPEDTEATIEKSYVWAFVAGGIVFLGLGSVILFSYLKKRKRVLTENK